MDGFNPDAYLAQKGALAGATGGGFNPDAYLKEKASTPHVGAVETFINSATNALPFGKQLVDMGSTAVMKLLSPSAGAKLTPQAEEEAKRLGVKLPEEPGLLDTYRSMRDTREARAVLGAAQNPDSDMAGKVVGTGLSLAAPLPGIQAESLAAKGAAPGLLAKAGAGALTGAGYGALSGLTGSSADLSKGEFGEAALDALRGAGIGAGIGGAASGLGAILSKYAAGKMGSGLQKADQMAADAFEKKQAAAQGALGADTQQGSRIIENMLRGESTGQLSGEQAETLQKLKDSGQWQALVQGVFRRNLEDLPGKLESIQAKQQALQDLAANKGHEIASSAAQLASPSEAVRQVANRVKPLMERTLVGKAFGALTEGAEGGNTANGFWMGRVIGPTKDALKRMASHPSVQVPAWRGMGAIGSAMSSDPSRLGKFGAVLSNIADQHGPDAAAAAHFVMSQTNPEYQKLAQGE